MIIVAHTNFCTCQWRTDHKGIEQQGIEQVLITCFPCLSFALYFENNCALEYDQALSWIVERRLREAWKSEHLQL